MLRSGFVVACIDKGLFLADRVRCIHLHSLRVPGVQVVSDYLLSSKPEVDDLQGYRHKQDKEDTLSPASDTGFNNGLALHAWAGRWSNV
jgi:hypothetical protein